MYSYLGSSILVAHPSIGLTRAVFAAESHFGVPGLKNSLTSIGLIDPDNFWPWAVALLESIFHILC